MPKVYIFAGPNGAGKTTVAREYLPNEGKVAQFVNADLIAAGISPFAPDTADVAAGRVMFARLDELVAREDDFGLETTLSGTWLVKKIRRWQEAGYFVELVYISICRPEIAIERVRIRVALGGHHIPDEVVRRRFVRSQHLLEKTYKSLVDHWIVYDNSGVLPVLVDEKIRV